MLTIEKYLTSRGKFFEESASFILLPSFPPHLPSSPPLSSPHPLPYTSVDLCCRIYLSIQRCLLQENLEFTLDNLIQTDNMHQPFGLQKRFGMSTLKCKLIGKLSYDMSIVIFESLLIISETHKKLVPIIVIRKCDRILLS